MVDKRAVTAAIVVDAKRHAAIADLEELLAAVAATRWNSVHSASPVSLSFPPCATYCPES
jgi:hypothetical protein